MVPEAPLRGFERAEFTARAARAQALMAENGLSGMLLTTEAEVRYFSGFHTRFWESPTRPWFLFLPTEGAPTAIIPEIGAEVMARTWVSDIRTWPAPRPTDDGLSLLTDLLAPMAQTGAAIGLPMGHETHLRMPLGDYHRLREDLSGLRLSDATEVIRALRMVKSPAEIAKIAHACAIADATFARIGALAAEGAPESDVFRQFKRTALSLGADDVAYLVGGAGPGGVRDIISPPSDRPLTRGDVLMLDTGVVWDGYFSDFDRNFSVGPASDATRQAHETLWRATEAGLSAARPGATCADLHRAMADVIGGEADVGRLGHGLGMQLTEWPSLAPWDQTVLTPGMVITLEPSLLLSGGRMIVHEENIVIAEGPPRLLTRRAPPELPVI